MSLQIILDDQTVDLAPGEVVTITKQVNDIAELKNRNSDFTNKFKLPPTAATRRLFEHADIIGSASRQPYRKLTARIIDDGVPILNNGYAITESGDFEVSIYPATVDFYSKIDGLSLRDLDLSAMNHYWNLTNVLGSFANTWNGGGYIYPIIDYNGMSEALREIDVRALLPGVFLAALWDRIHSEAGYTYSGEKVTDTRFRNIIIPFSSAPAQGDQNMASRVNQTVKVSTNVALNAPVAPIIWDNQGVATVPDTYNEATGLFQFVDNVTVRFSFDVDLLNNEGTDKVVHFSCLQSSDVELINVPAGQTINHTWSWDIACSQGQNIWFNAMTLGGGSPDVRMIAASEVMAEFLSGTPGGYAFAGPNNYITMGGMVPDIKQKEFIKAICQMLCLVPVPDPVTNNIHYHWFEEVKLNRGRAEDWSAKLDERSVKIEYRHGNYARVNILAYKEDDEIAGDLGNGSILIDDETLPDEAVLFELPFAASRMVTRLDGELVPFIDLIVGGDFSGDVAPRILVLEKRTQTGNPITYGDGNPFTDTDIEDDLPYAYFIHPDKTDNLGFGDDLIALQYQALALMLQDLKKITANFKLNQQDINKLDHFIPVWIKQFGHYFYLNRLEDYVSRRLTKCILIRL